MINVYKAPSHLTQTERRHTRHLISEGWLEHPGIYRVNTMTYKVRPDRTIYVSYKIINNPSGENRRIWLQTWGGEGPTPIEVAA